MPETPEVTRILSRWLSTLTYDQVPDDVRALARGTLLDYLGVALVGGTRPHVRAAADLALELGGNEQSTILAMGRRTSVDRAAFINGVAGSSAPQLDDVCKESLGHPGVGTHPAALAVGEWVGSSGQDLLTAIVAGYEMSWRVGAAIGMSAFNRGWHPRGGCNVFSAATASAILLGLRSEDEFCAVLGLAGNQAAGLMASCYWHDAWYLLSGHASQNGVSSAFLARAGYGAGTTVLEDPYGGYCSLVSENPDWDRMLEGLGERFELPGTGQKVHASSAATHAAIDATLELRAAGSIDVDDVAAVEVHTNAVSADTLGRRHPDSHVHGAMSVPFLVAVSLRDGQVGLEQFSQENLTSASLRSFQDRVEMIEDSELEAMSPKYLAARVVVRLRSGEETSATVITAKGDPENRLTPAELDGKFRRLAGEVLRPAAVDEVCEMVEHLEDLDDVRELTKVLRDIQ